MEIIRKGGLYFKLEWKHSRVVGLGEFINLIGLIIRTDNIGSNLNFISLCFLLLITYNYTTNKQINILLSGFETKPRPKRADPGCSQNN